MKNTEKKFDLEEIQVRSFVTQFDLRTLNGGRKIAGETLDEVPCTIATLEPDCR